MALLSYFAEDRVEPQKRNQPATSQLLVDFVCGVQLDSLTVKK